MKKIIYRKRLCDKQNFNCEQYYKKSMTMPQSQSCGGAYNAILDTDGTAILDTDGTPILDTSN